MATAKVLAVITKLLPRLTDPAVSAPTFSYGGDNIGAIQVVFRETKDIEVATLNINKLTPNSYELHIDTILSISVKKFNRLPTYDEIRKTLVTVHHLPDFVTFSYGNTEEYYNLDGVLYKKVVFKNA